MFSFFPLSLLFVLLPQGLLQRPCLSTCSEALFPAAGTGCDWAQVDHGKGWMLEEVTRAGGLSGGESGLRGRQAPDLQTGPSSVPPKEGYVDLVQCCISVSSVQGHTGRSSISMVTPVVTLTPMCV